MYSGISNTSSLENGWTWNFNLVIKWKSICEWHLVARLQKSRIEVDLGDFDSLIEFDITPPDS